jgi:hypothetical protein
MKRDVVYGPQKYQGLGISCLFTFQMTEHIISILKYCNATNHLTRQLISHTLEATKTRDRMRRTPSYKGFQRVQRTSHPNMVDTHVGIPGE